MWTKAVALLLSFLFLTGCSFGKDPLHNALAFRKNILESNGCSFNAAVTADYGEKIYKFTMHCITDQEGNLCFTVKEPETIAGITGKVASGIGAITFDDKVLAFPTIAEGKVSPVTGPWLLIKSLRSGYIRSGTMDNDGFIVSIDDTYEGESLYLEIYINNNTPGSAEVFWKGRRVLVITVEDFEYL